MKQYPCTNCYISVQPSRGFRPCIHGESKKCLEVLFEELGGYFAIKESEQVKRKFNGGPAV